MAGLIIGLRYNSGAAKPAALSTPEPLPAEVFPDAMFGQLTADIQAGNETAFLSLASPAARPAIRTWWNNLEAIGFTTGAVLPTASVDGDLGRRDGDERRARHVEVEGRCPYPLGPAKIRFGANWGAFVIMGGQMTGNGDIWGPTEKTPAGAAPVHAAPVHAGPPSAGPAPRPPWEAPPPGPPAPAGSGPPMRSADRNWWIIPYFGSAVSVIVVAALVIGLQHAFAGTPRASASATASASAPTGPMPAEMFPNKLFSDLTQEINSHNEAAFLRTASPHARPAMKTWWDNLNAIGFNAGAVIPTATNDTVRINSHGNGSTVVLAGTHNPLDPSYQGKPGVPLDRYRIGLHFSSATATGQITSWQPLDSNPWDNKSGLDVLKGTNVVVAGLPSDSGVVSETLSLAQSAANYVLGLFRQVNPNDLLQTGFVVFVSSDTQVRDGWFAADQQPKGWPLAWNGDRTFTLPGPGTSSDDYDSAPGGIADDTTGGARVVITPYEQSGETPQQKLTGLEREFMIDILAGHDQNLLNGPPAPSSTPDAWTIEGLGIATEALYAGSTNPAPAHYSFGPLTSFLHSLSPKFKTGKLPDAEELVGANAQQWNDVAASVYEYIEQKYGMNQMFASAVLMWTRYTTPFGNVEDVAKSNSNVGVFWKTSYLEKNWRAWLKRI